MPCIHVHVHVKMTLYAHRHVWVQNSGLHPAQANFSATLSVVVHVETWSVHLCSLQPLQALHQHLCRVHPSSAVPGVHIWMARLSYFLQVVLLLRRSKHSMSVHCAWIDLCLSGQLPNIFSTMFVPDFLDYMSGHTEFVHLAWIWGWHLFKANIYNLCICSGYWST